MPATWFRFWRDFDYWAIPGKAVIAYRQGWEGPVTRQCAKLAEQAGAGWRQAKPPGVRVKLGKAIPGG